MTRKARPLIPGAVTLAAVQVIPAAQTAEKRPALCLACYTTRHRVTLAYIPAGAVWSLSVPPLLPSKRDELDGLTLEALGGVTLTLESEGKTATLKVLSVRLTRELIEVLSLYDGKRLDLGAVS